MNKPLQISIYLIYKDTIYNWNIQNITVASFIINDIVMNMKLLYD